MADNIPVKKESKVHSLTWPLDTLRGEIDRLFEDFRRGPFGGRGALDMEPFWRDKLSFGKSPAVDIAEKDNRYEVTAELPGLSDKDIEVKYADGLLTISGEKKEEKEEKKKDYYLSERRYGAFQRSFQMPNGVDPDKIEATFRNGVLTVSLPKSADAVKNEKKVAIKTAA